LQSIGGFKKAEAANISIGIGQITNMRCFIFYVFSFKLVIEWLVSLQLPFSPEPL
jgi:hypothetical protein